MSGAQPVERHRLRGATQVDQHVGAVETSDGQVGLAAQRRERLLRGSIARQRRTAAAGSLAQIPEIDLEPSRPQRLVRPLELAPGGARKLGGLGNSAREGQRLHHADRRAGRLVRKPFSGEERARRDVVRERRGDPPPYAAGVPTGPQRHRQHARRATAPRRAYESLRVAAGLGRILPQPIRQAIAPFERAGEVRGPRFGVGQ